MLNGEVIDQGATVDVDADTATSLLEAGYQSDGTAVAPMWEKPTPRTKANKEATK